MTETREQVIERIAGESFTWGIQRAVCKDAMRRAMSFERERIREKVKAEISQEHANADMCCVRAMNNLLSAIEGEE